MISIPTRDVLTAQILAHLKASRPQTDTSTGSPEWARVKSIIEMVWGLHYQIRSALLDVWPSANSSDDAIVDHANLRIGPNARRSATPAKGTLALRVTGTSAGATVAAGDTLAHSDGTRFQLTTGGLVGVGTLDVSLEAITTGTIGNKLTGDSLVFESPPAGITAAAALVADLDGGLDQETIAELLERVLVAYRKPPAGGRFSDFWNWAMTISDVASAYVYGPSSYNIAGRRGMGIVDVAILAHGTGSARIPSTALVQAVQDYIDSVRPNPMREGLVIKPRALAQDVILQLVPAQGYEFDYTGSPGGDMVLNYSAHVITWYAALPATLRARIDSEGSARLFIKGQVFTATSYDAGTPSTTITETPSPALVGGEYIWPAGPLSAAALAAILDHFDTLGPARSTYADPEQWWEDTLRVAQLHGILLGRTLSDGTQVGIAGCDDAIVSTPGTNVVPADDLVLGPQVLVPGTITIRPW